MKKKKIIQKEEQNINYEDDILPGIPSEESEEEEEYEQDEELDEESLPEKDSVDEIHIDIIEEFNILEQPTETIPPHLTSKKEIPFSVLRKLGEGKKLDNLLNGMTACGCGKNFTEPIGGEDEDDYSLTRKNKE